MRFQAVLTIALVVFCWSTVFSSQQEIHVAMVKTVSGEVSLVRGGNIISPSPGEQLMVADILETGAEGTVGIIFTDGSMLSVGPESTVNIAKYVFQPKDENYSFSLYLKKGMAMYTSGKLGKLSPESVKLKTPRATVGIRGTKLIIKVDE